MSHICTIYVYIHGRIEANLKLKTQQSQPEIGCPVLAQACVRWPIGADYKAKEWAWCVSFEARAHSINSMIRNILKNDNNPEMVEVWRSA